MPGCFWSGWEINKYQFCEEQLCGFVVEPANTWSNIGYLITAILIFRSTKVQNKRVRNLFLISVSVLFIGSTFFHLSGTLVGKLIDVGAMLFLSMTILTFSVQRFFSLKEIHANLFYVIGVSLSLWYLLETRLGAPLFALQLFIATILEFILKRKNLSLDMSKIRMSILVLISAFCFWLLDFKKILCHPGNHFLTGHAMWHLLAAVAIWIYYQSYGSKSLSVSASENY